MRGLLLIVEDGFVMGQVRDSLGLVVGFEGGKVLVDAAEGHIVVMGKEGRKLLFV